MPRSRNKRRSSAKHSIVNPNITSCPICNKKITNLSKHLSSSANQHCNHILGDRSIISLIPSTKQKYKINKLGQASQMNSKHDLLSTFSPKFDNIQSIHATLDTSQSQFISSMSNLPHVQNLNIDQCDFDINTDIDNIGNQNNKDDSKLSSQKFDNSKEKFVLEDIILNEHISNNQKKITQDSSGCHSNNILTQMQLLQITHSDVASEGSIDEYNNTYKGGNHGNIHENECDVVNQIPIIRYGSFLSSRRVTRSMNENNQRSENTSSIENKDSANNETNHQLFLNPNVPGINESTSANTKTTQDRFLTKTLIHQLPHKYDYRSYQLTIWKNRYDNVLIDSDTLSSLKLMKIMTKSNIPNYCFTEIMQWFEESHQSKLDEINNQSKKIPTHCYNSIPKNKDRVIKDIKNILTNNEKRFDPKPIHKILQLPSGRFVRHSSISLQSIIYSLISIPEMLNEYNSLLHNRYFRDPLLIEKIPINERYYHDIHTGWWFKNAHMKHCTDVHDVLCPVILFIDGTAIDSVGKLKLEAIMITLGIFTRQMRNKAEAWRLLGFICDPNKENLGNDKYISQVEKRTDYHHILKELLQELYELEISDGILIDLPINKGKDVETIRLKFCLMFIMGDAVGHDNLCDMFLSYTSSSSYLCRDCNCPSTNLNDPFWKCEITNREQLLMKSSIELSKLCYYKIENNAFNRHSFGGDKSNINGCSPPEILHQFLKGPMEDTINHFFESITIPGLDFLVEVGKYLSLNWHRQSCRQYPNIQIFKDGLQKKHLCGKELFSQLFMMYLALIQTYTMKYMPRVERESNPRHKMKKVKVNNYKDTINESDMNDESLSHNKDGNQKKKSNVYESVKHIFNKVADKKEVMHNWIKLMEMTFCFYQWQIQSEISVLDFQPSVIPSTDSTTENNGPSPATKQIRKFMSLHNKVISNRLGNGTNKAKFHWNLHLTYYGPKFGAFLNTDGGIGERNLKPKVKEPARRTQKRQYVLANQASERDYERTVIQTMYDLMSLKGIVIPSHTTTRIDEKYPAFNQLDDCTSIDNSIDNLNREYITSGDFTVHFNDELTKIKYVRGSGNKMLNKKMFLEHTFIQQVMNRLKSQDYQIRSSFLSCFTCLKFENDWLYPVYDKTMNEKIPCKNNHAIFRADPWYYGKPWFDWCMTNWSGDERVQLFHQNNSTNNDDEMLFPSKILMFIDPSKMDFGNTSLETNGSLWAVVQSTTDDDRTTNHKPNMICNLMDTYKIDDKIRIISCDNIVRDTYVICDVNSVQKQNQENRNIKISNMYRSQHVMCFKPIETWSTLFINNEW
jgi:hypothetical protein